MHRPTRIFEPTGQLLTQNRPSVDLIQHKIGQLRGLEGANVLETMNIILKEELVLKAASEWF